MRVRPLASALTVVGVCAATAVNSLAAQDSPSCFSANDIPVGQNFFEVEGPLSNYDYAARTMTTMGVTVHFPDDPVTGEPFEFDVGGGEYTSFDKLVDENTELYVRKILGEPDKGLFPATIIAIGTLVDNTEGCAEYVANEAEFLFAEHVTVGPLNGVDLEAKTFQISGITIQMSDDPRVPQQLLDASGNPGEVTLEVLADPEFRGTIAGGDGFMEKGLLRGFIIETSAFRRRTDGRENVIIEVARYGADDAELRAVGYVTTDGISAPAATHVQIYSGTGDDGVEVAAGGDARDGVTCSGSLRGTATLAADPLDPAREAYTFRRELPDGTPDQENICVRTGTMNGDTFVAHSASGSNSREIDVR